MPLSKITHIFNSKIFSKACGLMLVFMMILRSTPALAIYEGVRSGVQYQSSTTCDTGELEFNPFMNNKDLNWELSNPACVGFIAGVGAAMIIAEKAMGTACTPTNYIGLTKLAQEEIEKRSTPTIPYLNNTIVIKQGIGMKHCASRISENAQLSSQCAAQAGVGPDCAAATMAASDIGFCCGGVAAYYGIVGVAVSTLALMYNTAKITYENARVCGHDWYKWEKDANDYWVKGKGVYRKCVENLFLKTEPVSQECKDYEDGIGDDSADFEVDIKNKYYREYIFGGKEYEDNSSDSCANPWNATTRMSRLGYSSNKQRYYARGPGINAIYACHRFLTYGNDAEANKAFECCKQKSQSTICIQNRAGLGDILGPYETKFCTLGSKCNVGNVDFSIYESKSVSGYICASTYSVCPYNHLLGGGTEVDKYYSVESGKIGQMENYCQYLKHCVKVPAAPNFRYSSLEGAYISKACRDMVGDSQNVYSFTSELLPVSNRGFTAPIAQCVKETIENLFFNIAGDTECVDSNESPNQLGECSSGYKYREGYPLSTKSVFSKIQDNLRSVIKVVLVGAITVFGYATLMAVPGAYIEKKKIFPFLLKIALVMYFALGDAWKEQFAEGVMGASSFLSELVFKVDDDVDASKQDGCQFPKFNYADSNPDTMYNNPAYSVRNQYLRVWDTFDCKIARALGFGPEVSVPNIIMMILGGFLTGGLGIVFFLASFFFAFMLISIALRALHIFLVSTIAVAILLYVSPLTIAASMFERTKSIFTNWLKQLLGLILQPMILFAYLAVLISLFDKVLIGDDVTFTGSGKESPKQISCTGEAKNTSIYCIFQIADIKTYNGFETLGIGLPMLASMDQNKMQTIIKAAIIMFIFMKFMEKIDDLAEKLVGGPKMSPSGAWATSTGAMAKGAYDLLRGVQQRGMGGMKVAATTMVPRAIDALKGTGSMMGNKGKSISEVGKAKDSVSSTSAQDDKVGSENSGSKGLDTSSSLAKNSDGAGSQEKSEKSDSDGAGSKEKSDSDGAGSKEKSESSNSDGERSQERPESSNSDGGAQEKSESSSSDGGAQEKSEKSDSDGAGSKENKPDNDG